MIESPAWILTPRQQFDLELLISDAFAPLNGFLSKQDYDSVCEHMRLADHTLWPMPIVLDVTPEFAEKITASKNTPEHKIPLKDTQGLLVAWLTVSDLWEVSEQDKLREAEQVYGTTSLHHPGVRYLMHHTHSVYLGGKVTKATGVTHYDFMHLRHTPAQLQEKFTRLGWQRIVAFQTRNPMHRAHVELTQAAARECRANLLLHPVVGPTKPGDIDYFTRVRCYEKILSRYSETTTVLSLLPLAMRMAGPREALWHALIRQNYGCTHFIIGRDHAGVADPETGEGFYAPYAAQQLTQQHQQALDITIVPFQEMVYSATRSQYVSVDAVKSDETVNRISGTELRRRLQEDIPIPDWFSYPEVLSTLRHAYPAKHQQGFTVFFTGLSGAGKSTLAFGLLQRLQELGDRQVTMLDGDEVRLWLSNELGFSPKDRDINVNRIGHVAREVTRHGGVAICAPIAPYHRAREVVRDLINEVGMFVEVYVSTSLDVCEARDCKGLYAQARAGKIPNFTGVSDPYEVPERAELVLDTSECRPEQCVQTIIVKLAALGLIKGE